MSGSPVSPASVNGDKKRDSYDEDIGPVAQGSEDDFQLLTAENRKAGERQLVKKLDFRLLPTIVIIFLMNYIDVSDHLTARLSCVSLELTVRHCEQRVAVTSARLQGLETDLGLTGKP